MVYIRPPLDSSVENSMNNGMYPMEEVGFEVKSPHHVAHMPEEINGLRRQGTSELVFSETSTEMSNSDSIREVSPGDERVGHNVTQHMYTASVTCVISSHSFIPLEIMVSIFGCSLHPSTYHYR